MCIAGSRPPGTLPPLGIRNRGGNNRKKLFGFTARCFHRCRGRTGVAPLPQSRGFGYFVAFRNFSRTLLELLHVFCNCV
ncbi:hypothetical protein NDU88_002432 [Pleurodeles waltl]|uniref:Uncharacterized protein n=1 Tax=Pleurodeles waltl TaxID=8319 RepID=A0AAV7WPG6_PLEWA|nr:hypothetical protein NDU88_002432 [Pleurodeles waltl]